MGMNQYEWEGMGLKKTFPLISNSGATAFTKWWRFGSALSDL